MEAVGPRHTGIPRVWNDGVELAFDTERYSDDAVVPVAAEEALVAMLSQQDAVAPKFRVRHVPTKEEYLYITWSGQVGVTKAIRHAEYGKAQRRDKRRGIWVLGSQVLSEAAGTRLRRRVRGALAEWATATIHLAAAQDVARVFTEQVLAQVVAQTRGELPSETDVYRLAAPMGRVWRRKIQVHFKQDSSTLWRVLWLALQVRHPRTVMYRAAVQQQLRVMNTTRQAQSAWSIAWWYQHGAAATESVLRRAPREIGWEIVDVTAELRQREGRPTLRLLWDTWASTVPGADVAVYTDTVPARTRTKREGVAWVW